MHCIAGVVGSGGRREHALYIAGVVGSDGRREHALYSRGSWVRWQEGACIV